VGVCNARQRLEGDFDEISSPDTVEVWPGDGLRKAGVGFDQLLVWFRIRVKLRVPRELSIGHLCPAADGVTPATWHGLVEVGGAGHR
jgi:hypothetical protein